MRLLWCPQDAALPATRRGRGEQLLRAVLAPLVGRPAASLQFGREDHGRPFLRHPGAPDFNLSDTAGGSLVALCRQGRVGIDLERGDRRPPVARLARRWFANEEATALTALPAERQALAFLHLWTAKEASCKATGTGIYGHLSRWRFAVDRAEPDLLALPAEAGPRRRWRYLRLAPGGHHTAVVAVQDGEFLQLRAFTLRC